MYESVKNTGLEYLNDVLKQHKEKLNLLSKLHSNVSVQKFSLEEKKLINDWIADELVIIGRTKRSIKILEESNEPKQ